MNWQVNSWLFTKKNDNIFPYKTSMWILRGGAFFMNSQPGNNLSVHQLKKG